MLSMTSMVFTLLLQFTQSCTTQDDASLRQTLVVVGHCRCRQYLDVYAICVEEYFSSCVRFPRAFKTHLTCFKLHITGIKKIVPGDFSNLTHLTVLHIDVNRDLMEIEPGVFDDLKNLLTLSISYNPKLTKLDERIFKGLDNLESLTLTRNGFNDFKDFTPSLKTAYLPKLQTLIMEELDCPTVNEDDFVNLSGSNVRSVLFDESQINFMHPDALVPLKHLQTLSVSETMMSNENLVDVLGKITEANIPLRLLNLQGWGFKDNVPKDLFIAIANTTVQELVLNRNQFHFIDENTFPKMPNIVNLVIEENTVKDVKKNAFSNFPRLKQLNLKNNKLIGVPNGVLFPTIEILDLSGNTMVASSYFTLGRESFVIMSSLKVLDLSENNLRKIYEDTFSGLMNLKKLNLYHSNVLFINDNSFGELTNLGYLNLGHNSFPQRTFQKATFRGLSSLKYLSLESCKIDHFPKTNIFGYLTSLETLNLRDNLLMDVTPEFVASINTLKVLNVDDNKIIMWHHRIFKDTKMENLTASRNTFTHLTEAMLADISEFKMIDVSDNPFYCNCEYLIESFNILAQTKIDHVLSILDQTNTYCLLPESSENTTIGNYYRNNHVPCQKKKITNLIKYLIPSLICVASILSVVVLSYIYRWHIRYWVLLMKIAISKRTHLKQGETVRGHTSYLYDAFVSYSTEDRNFVIRLVSMLENYEPFLKLCVYERDFEIGTIISESVLECLSRSRKTLLIISDSYIKSQWCTWEAQVAENHRLFFENECGECVNDSLIMIRLGYISSHNISPMLKYLMKTRIYLQWDPSDGKQEQFWEKIRNALAPASNRVEEKTVDIKP